MGKINCIGILTSGGDAPGMNAAIRAVTRAGIAAGYEVLAFGLNALKAVNIIALPAVNGYLRPAELLYDLFGIDAVFCILLFCFFVDCVHVDLLI